MNNEEAIKIIKQQEEMLKRLTEAALKYGIVLTYDGPKKMIIALGNETYQVNRVKGVKPGDVVTITPQTGQVVAKSGIGNPNGNVAVATSEARGNQCDVEYGGEEASRYISEYVDAKKLKRGKRVLLDKSGSIILAILDDLVKAFKTKGTGVTWDDIGGNEVAKAELRDAIRLMKGAGKIASSYGLATPKGVLLYGPPGCGKTMLGKAAATELAPDGEGAFMYIKSPEIVSPYVGASEANVRQIFAEAKAYKKETGKPMILFFDEAESILSRRGSGISADVERRLVPAFLLEMDGLEDTGAFVILATNRPDTLDEAVIRDGRIDRRIAVERPSPVHGREIFTLGLRNAPIANCSTVDSIAEIGTEILYRDYSPVQDKISGALIAAALDRAKRRAAFRDMENGEKKPTGLTNEDIIESIKALEDEYS